MISKIHGFIGKVHNSYLKNLKNCFEIFQTYTEYVDSSDQIPQNEIQDNTSTLKCIFQKLIIIFII